MTIQDKIKKLEDISDSLDHSDLIEGALAMSIQTLLGSIHTDNVQGFMIAINNFTKNEMAKIQGIKGNN